MNVKNATICKIIAMIPDIILPLNKKESPGKIIASKIIKVEFVCLEIDRSYGTLSSKNL